MDKIFTPPIPTDKEGKAIVAPYPLRKVEAVLARSGFNVIVTTPEKLEKVVTSKGTKVIGINVHDPRGIEPVSAKLSMIFGGGETWTAKFFDELGEIVSRLKEKYHLKVVIGGAGSWQFEKDPPSWADVIFLGHAEVDFPEVVKRLEEGEALPKIIRGKYPRKLEDIPPIISPARGGEVQITRGCPRGCWFCSVTPDTFISFPIDYIMKEVQVNMKAGIKDVSLITDDMLLYGTKRLNEVNHDAIIRLYTELKRARVDYINFAHISAAPVKLSPKTVKAMSEIAEWNEERAVSPVVGLETGSEKIFNKYMKMKAFPWNYTHWKDLIVEATAIMNESYIFPCYTMTIGYPEETDKDVEDSIKLVEYIIDHEPIAWIFPLPVIPMGLSKIRDNPLPALERLPSRYWDLLYLSWKYDLKITRRLGNAIAYTSKNPFIRSIVTYMIDKVFNTIEWYFERLKETKGKSALEYKDLNLNTTYGVIWSIFQLFKLAFSSSSLSK
ncbi:B12-binding domain-containing radical SAM protein [Sulfolobus sp. E11-6]|uniref:B12-binding domain-containing radical SAM protein n=1 Tax=Sulfolobus sp. E11-6 TaxID=2663020 RepID=UPI001297A6CF|nr:radical SAM protein [Sulfolobus sp. E11-6]QGA68189.1 radical SAM protein [Sulfolobus sp. E11-6]